MYILLFLLGLLLDGIFHLIIPFFVVRSGKQYPNNTLWLIALGGGLLGMIIVAILGVNFTIFAAILNSGLWVLVGYTILYRKCSIKQQETKQENPQETQEEK